MFVRKSYKKLLEEVEKYKQENAELREMNMMLLQQNEELREKQREKEPTYFG